MTILWLVNSLVFVMVSSSSRAYSKCVPPEIDDDGRSFAIDSKHYVKHHGSEPGCRLLTRNISTSEYMRKALDRGLLWRGQHLISSPTRQQSFQVTYCAGSCTFDNHAASYHMRYTSESSHYMKRALLLHRFLEVFNDPSDWPDHQLPHFSCVPVAYKTPQDSSPVLQQLYTYYDHKTKGFQNEDITNLRVQYQEVTACGCSI